MLVRYMRCALYWTTTSPVSSPWSTEPARLKTTPWCSAPCWEINWRPTGFDWTELMKMATRLSSTTTAIVWQLNIICMLCLRLLITNSSNAWRRWGGWWSTWLASYNTRPASPSLRRTASPMMMTRWCQTIPWHQMTMMVWMAQTVTSWCQKTSTDLSSAMAANALILVLFRTTISSQKR